MGAALDASTESLVPLPAFSSSLSYYDGCVALAARPICRANKMAIRVGLINKPAPHHQVIDILQRLARQSEGSIVDMNPRRVN